MTGWFRSTNALSPSLSLGQFWSPSVMVNFELTWLGQRMPRDLVKHYFWVCLWVFPEKISIWIVGLNKTDGPPQCGWASFNLLKIWIEQKGRVRLNLLYIYMHVCVIGSFSLEIIYIYNMFFLSGEPWLTHHPSSRPPCKMGWGLCCYCIEDQFPPLTNYIAFTPQQAMTPGAILPKQTFLCANLYVRVGFLGNLICILCHVQSL